MAEITFSVSSSRVSQSLLLCLTSVIMGNYIPEVINIRLESDHIETGFYFDRVMELARLDNIEVNISIHESTTVHAARDWMVKACKTEFLWMGDEDVVYDSACLEYFDKLMDFKHGISWKEHPYVVGTKLDVSNRRGFRDYSSKWQPAENYVDFCPYYYRYISSARQCVKTRLLDTGNAVLHIPTVREENYKFNLHPDTAKCGGEDTLFALQVQKSGKIGLFHSRALSYHLEKPGVSFTEEQARKDALLRMCEIHGFDKKIILEEFN